MTRRSLLNLLSKQEQQLPQVWGWYEFQRTLVGEEKRRVRDALAGGSSPLPSRYFGKTPEELEDDFTYQASELAQLTMLGMLACTEAALRIDFIERVAKKRKDQVSRRFRETYRKRGIEKVRLEEDILDTWGKHGASDFVRSSVAEFKGALNLRHWLAHGRYWKPKLGRAAGYAPGGVFDICLGLLQTVGWMPADVPRSPFSEA